MIPDNAQQVSGSLCVWKCMDKHIFGQFENLSAVSQSDIPTAFITELLLILRV